MENDSLRSRRWTGDPRARYWWHRLPGMDYVPPIYSALAKEEWVIMRDWFEATDENGRIGECAVPLLSLLHGLIMGNRADRIVQLGTCAGYSSLLLGFMLRRMKAVHGLFTLDHDPAVVAISRGWLARAELDRFVQSAELDSTSPAAVEKAIDYLGNSPDLIIVDSSHQYHSTLAELDLWYPMLAPGGLVVLHDASQFAERFDCNQEGGVRRAFNEWRAVNPTVEAILLNGEARTMEGPRPLYKDACGLAILHKSTQPGAA